MTSVNPADDGTAPGGPAGEPSGGELRIVAAAQLSATQLGRIQAIYAQAFPPHLRVPLADLAVPGSRDQFLTALDGDDPVGFAALRLLAAPRWAFLRYYGVAADRRRRGYGVRFWHQLAPMLVPLGWPARIAFEVEDPADAHDDAAERAIRRGRIAFWERCGAAVLPVPGYVMPALTSIGHPEPMILMGSDPEACWPLPGPELAALVRAIFTEHYGLPPDHRLVTGAIASIKDGSG